jgi:hypothetical protein
MIDRRGITVGIAVRYVLDDPAVAVRDPVRPYVPHCLCGPPSLLSTGYRGFFP